MKTGRSRNENGPQEDATLSDVVEPADVNPEAHVEELAAEGYRFYASESREFAATSIRAVSEAITD